jgi:hypothetical protein
VTRTRIKTIRTDRRPATGGLTRGVRDTGIVVRPAPLGAPKRRTGLAVALLGASLLIVALLAAALVDRCTPSDAADSAAQAVGTTERAEPTPHFATCENVSLHLPVDPGALTALAFHQASNPAALHMTSLVPDADMERAAEVKAEPGASATADGRWTGSCLRLWRSNRTGEPDTAADVGADPGTAVLSPVTGTIIEVKAYKLYGRFDDYEIHIQPDGRPGMDVVLIHVADVQVQAGQRVEGGITRLAVVRKMSDKMELQLGGYTANGGDHVHVQVNAVKTPGELEEPGGS